MYYLSNEINFLGLVNRTKAVKHNVYINLFYNSTFDKSNKNGYNYP